jgi:O-antigen/teichoic acid export membrane protein
VTNGESERDNTAPAAVAVPPRTPAATDMLRRAPSAYLWNQLGSLWLFASSFALSLIATRGLGKEPYGIFSIALTFFNTAVYAAAFGLEDAATVFVPRTLAERGRGATGALMRRILLARTVAVLLICVAVYVVVPPLRTWLLAQSFTGAQGMASALYIPAFPSLALPLVVYIAGAGLMNMLGALFTALLRTRLTLVVGGLAQVGNVVGVYVAARQGYGVAGVIWALGLVAWAAALAYVALLLPLLRARETAAPASTPEPFTPVLRLGATAWLTNLISGALLKQSVVSLMLYFFVATTLFGYFNLAFQLSHAAAFLLIAGLGGVGMAAMAAAFSGEDRAGLAIAWRSVSKAQMLLAVPVLAFFFIRADAIAVLLYGPDFAPVGALMQVFLVFNIAQRIAGGGSHQAALYVLGRQRWAFATQVAGLLLTVVIGAALIPQKGIFGGPGGALIAVGAGQVAVELLQLALAWRLLRRAYPIQFGLRVVLALAPAVLVTVVLRVDSSSVLSGIIGAGGLSPAVASAINLAISGVIFTAVLVGGMLIARPVEGDDVALLAKLNPRLRPILAAFAHRAAPSPAGGGEPGEA